MQHFRSWMIWQIIAADIMEMMFCDDNNRVNELIDNMKKNSGCTWRDIVLAYSYVEVDVQRWGSN